jgi:hypothetical protein
MGNKNSSLINDTTFNKYQYMTNLTIKEIINDAIFVNDNLLIFTNYKIHVFYFIKNKIVNTFSFDHMINSYDVSPDKTKILIQTVKDFIYIVHIKSRKVEQYNINGVCKFISDNSIISLEAERVIYYKIHDGNLIHDLEYIDIYSTILVCLDELKLNELILNGLTLNQPINLQHLSNFIDLLNKNTLCISPDRTKILFVINNKYGIFCLFCVKTNNITVLKNTTGYYSNIRPMCLLFSNNNKFFISTDDYKIVTWDMQTLKIIKEYSLPDIYISSISISSDDKRVFIKTKQSDYIFGHFDHDAYVLNLNKTRQKWINTDVHLKKPLFNFNKYSDDGLYLCNVSNFNTVNILFDYEKKNKYAFILAVNLNKDKSIFVSNYLYDRNLLPLILQYT